jgi:hypothetical protein
MPDQYAITYRDPGGGPLLADEMSRTIGGTFRESGGFAFTDPGRDAGALLLVTDDGDNLADDFGNLLAADSISRASVVTWRERT